MSKEYPKLALFEEAEPVFGIIKETKESDPRLVMPDNPPKYFGTVTDLKTFCKVFGLDFPRELA